MTSFHKAPLPPSVRAKTVTAVLGPTNTGKTHLALERMIGHESGVIGLPLRLLAREVYGRLAARVGEGAVALVTGEEKIVGDRPRYWVCTVEAMPREIDAAFVAIDEVQIAGDLERGHVFTDRILNARGRAETLLLGALTARPLIEKLLPGVAVVTRPRLSKLAYAGQKKLTRLPARSAVVAFSAEEVYEIAELVRRQRGGAAVVMGALSPRTRNAQVELYQSGDVDFLVATDAIGMGLNLAVDHVAFASNRKFDGYRHRNLTPAELGQIAGRAGRHLSDGTFGVTARVEPFDDELIRALENHQFQPVRQFQWRNRVLDFGSIDRLKRSLDESPREEGLTKAPPADDVTALEIVSREAEIAGLADRPGRVALLWDVCQVPDYRRIAPAQHAELVSTLFEFLVREGRIPDDWFARQVAFADRTDGDIDTLSTRIAHIRTWTFVANRPDWVRDPAHWQERTRRIEDALSDALHERLTQRFVDRRTSVLIKRLRENAMLDTEIAGDGDVLVEGHRVGRLEGFRFVPEAAGGETDARAVRNAAAKALASEIEARADRLSRAPNGDFVLSSDGTIRWLGAAIARVAPGDKTLSPRAILLADEQLTGPAREKVQARIDLWLSAQLQAALKPLFDLDAAEGLEGLSRGIAYRLVEALGVIDRAQVSEDLRNLDQASRAALRKLGVRFGAYHVFVPALLKPGPSALLAQLHALREGGLDQPGLAELGRLSQTGRTSIPVDPAIPNALYRLFGYRVSGARAVRIDILERLADIIRPLIAWKPLDAGVAPPPGAIASGGGFVATGAMTSLVGCSGEDFASILKSLGYRLERRKREEAEAPPLPAAARQPAQESGDAGAAAAPSEADESGADRPEAVEHENPERAAADMGGSAIEAAAPDMAVASPESGAPPAPSAAEPALSDGSTAAPADAAAAAKPLPEFVEVWRPGRAERHRRDDGGRPEQRQGRRPPPRNADAPRPATGFGAQKRDGGPRRDHSRQDDPEGARARGESRERAAERGERPQRRPDRSERPQRSEKPVDPTSPFAALAALKAELEAKAKAGR